MRRGFTLTEILVSLAIIIILAGILLPMGIKSWNAARRAQTTAIIHALSVAIDQYKADHGAYPGPLHDHQVHRNAAQSPAPPAPATINTVAAAGWDSANVDLGLTTMSENLALGLFGGLRWDTTDSEVKFDPNEIGQGPSNLTPRNYKRRYPAYLDGKYLSVNSETGTKTGDLPDFDDTLIPEILDREKMPILYLRAKVTSDVPLTATGYGNGYNGVVTNNTNDANGGFRYGRFDISQIIGYTGVTGLTHGLKTVSTAATLSATTPNDAFPYLQHSVDKTRARENTYILISAGADRVYGTKDDICSFGDVIP